MPASPDYYEVLQVSPNADGEVIQAAYKRLVDMWHSERRPGDPSSFERLAALDEAYAVLSDPPKRREYDARVRPSAAGRAVVDVPSHATAQPGQAVASGRRNGSFRITPSETSGEAPLSTVPVDIRTPAPAREPTANEAASARRPWVWLAAVAVCVATFGVGNAVLTRGRTPPSPADEHHAADSSPLSPDALFARISPGVVKVVVQDRYGRTIGSGSGFLVGSSNLVATNYHVIEKAHKAHVVLAGETKVEGAENFLERFETGETRVPVLGVAAYDEEADLAIIKLDKRISAQPLELATGDLPPVGTKVYAIGNPLGLANTLSDGLVSGHRELDRITEIQTTAPISPGSSGGPLLLADGRVVGVTTFLVKGGQNLNFAVPATQVDKLLIRCGSDAQLTPLPVVEDPEILEDDTASPDFWNHIIRGNEWFAKKEYDKAIKEYTDAIHIQPRKSLAYSFRGSAWRYKHNYGKAIEDYNEAIRINPKDSLVYEHRGEVWCVQKNYEYAVKDFAKSMLLAPSIAHKHYRLGWLLATCPDGRVRDGKRAIVITTAACELSSWKKRQYLDALGAAYAETGQFDVAERYVRMAIEATDSLFPSSDELQSRLALYKRRTPYRQAQ